MSFVISIGLIKEINQGSFITNRLNMFFIE